MEWLKNMVTDRKSEGILDPRIPEKPQVRALKKALLVALKCVDPDSQKRPKMGHVIHMLEVDDFPYRDVSSGSRILAIVYLSCAYSCIYMLCFLYCLLLSAWLKS